jgi:hypothetical protein
VFQCASTDGRLLKSVDSGVSWVNIDGTPITDGAVPVACGADSPVRAAGVACITGPDPRPALILFDTELSATVVWDVTANAVWVPAPGETLSVECDEYTADIEPVCLVDSAGVFTRRADKITVFVGGVLAPLPPTFVDPVSNTPVVLAPGETVGACDGATPQTVERSWCNDGSLWVAVFPVDPVTGAPVYGSAPLAVWDYGPVNAPYVPPLQVLWADLQAAVVAGVATLGVCAAMKCETC